MRPIFIAALLLFSAAAGEAQTAQLVGDLPRKDNRPLTALPGLETEYGLVRTSEGVRLRTILTRPTGTRGPLPAILLAQWVSCGSLDFGAGRQSLLRDLAEQSGMVLARVERAGTGDREGPSCDRLDYDTEVRHYREAFDQLARHPWVDGDRIVIFGNSLGATTAPLIGEGKKVAGIVVQGGGAVTYLERMINFDRLYLERSGRYRPEQIHEEMVRNPSSPASGRRSAAAPKRPRITAALMPGTSRRRAGISSRPGPGSKRRFWSSTENMTSSNPATATG
jgi:hypothetical protein